MESTSEAKQINTLVYSLIISLTLLLIAVSSRADDWEHRLGQGVPFAAGIGAEVTYGNYGSGADATVVTMPVILAVNPLDALDMTFELPLVYLSSRSSGSSNAVVVTQSGGAGRRRGTTNVTTSPTLTSLTTTSSAMVNEAGLGDISLSAGWTVMQENELMPKIRPTLYLKAPSGDKDHGLGTGTFEIGPGLSVSKWLGNLQLFAEGAYIFQDSINSYQGKDYVSYSAGGGVQATDRLFVSLYGKGSTTRISGGTAPVEGRVKLNFLQSRRMSWEFYALAGFTNASPAAGGGMLVMYQF